MAETRERSIAKRMAALFAGHEGARGTHGEPGEPDARGKRGIKETARTLREAPTEAHFAAHIAGKAPLGIVPVREDSTCLWGSIDVDEYEGDHGGIVERAAELGLVPARSKSGGLHLFVFLLDPQPAAAVRRKLAALAKKLGLGGSEVFPKQSCIREGDFGNWIVLPYFGSTFGGALREQVGLKPGGGEMDLGEFLRVADKAKLGADAFTALGGGRRKVREPSQDARPFPGAPECLRRAAEDGVPEGQRNDTLFSMGTYAKQAHPGDWKDRVAEYNNLYLRPPLPFDEVTEVVRSLSKKAYAYRRDGRPICDQCTKPECRGSFGLGSSPGDNLPVFQKVVITTPPDDDANDDVTWTVTLGSGHTITVSSDDVYAQTQFGRICFRVTGWRYAKVKDAEWAAILNEAAGRAERVTADRDQTLQEQFRLLLETFLVNLQRGRRREDILDGRPFEDEEEGRHYFTMPSFKKFLVREGWDKDELRQRSKALGARIKALGGGMLRTSIRGKSVDLRWVPSGVVYPMPEVEPPPVGEMPL